MAGVSMLAAGLAGVAYAQGLAGVATDAGPLVAAGMRAPMSMLWIVGPMLLGVAGAVTVGWRRGLRPEGDGNGD